MVKKHVFLSYSHDNQKEASKLRKCLLDVGEKVWWDQDILGGQDWNYAIHKAMEEAYAVVVCFSREVGVKARSGIYPELRHAIDAYREYAPGAIFLIPIRLSECSIPAMQISDTQRLDGLQYIDLFPPSKWQDGFERLVTSLRNTPGHPSLARHREMPKL